MTVLVDVLSEGAGDRPAHGATAVLVEALGDDARRPERSSPSRPRPRERRRRRGGTAGGAAARRRPSSRLPRAGRRRRPDRRARTDRRRAPGRPGGCRGPSTARAASRGTSKSGRLAAGRPHGDAQPSPGRRRPAQVGEGGAGSLKNITPKREITASKRSPVRLPGGDVGAQPLDRRRRPAVPPRPRRRRAWPGRCRCRRPRRTARPPRRPAGSSGRRRSRHRGPARRDAARPRRTARRLTGANWRSIEAAIATQRVGPLTRPVVGGRLARDGAARRGLRPARRPPGRRR